jgi:hypothetical protein
MKNKNVILLGSIFIVLMLAAAPGLGAPKTVRPTTTNLWFDDNENQSITVTAGDVVVINGTVDQSPDSGKIQIQECEVGIPGVPAPSASCLDGALDNGNWTAISSGLISNDPSYWNFAFDTTGLSGVTIGFQTHYVPNTKTGVWAESISNPYDLIIT